MLIELDKHSGVPIFRQIMEQVTQHVLTGQLAEGAQLVTVRELAAQLKVNPMTVSKAYSLLELAGLVHKQRGIGLFVSRPNSELKRKAKLAIIEKMVRKTALHAHQLDLPETEVQALFSKVYREIELRRRNRHE